jgi:hypothetical protein
MRDREERYRRFERRVRPLALYTLVCVPVLTIQSTVYDVRLQLGAQPMPPILYTLVVAWSVTVFAALVVTAAAGVASLCYDSELTAERRAVWGVAFVFTGFFASALFVVLRWRRERRAIAEPAAG